MELEQKQLEEYKEANTNMRHFSNMRIAVLTLSLAINGVLFQSVMQQENIFILSGLILLGIVSTLSLLIFENRVTFYYLSYYGKAKELEQILQLNLYSPAKKKKFLQCY